VEGKSLYAKESPACGKQRRRSHQADRNPAGQFALPLPDHARQRGQPQSYGQPFGFNYSFVSTDYAKNAGGLLLVRPRVLGNKGYGFLETTEPREFPIEFDGPAHDTDDFEITIPTGYVVDDVPLPVDADYGFASYHSKTEVKGNVINYQRTFEVKELSVPVSRAEELRKFYRIIATDERNTVVLKAAVQ